MHSRVRVGTRRKGPRSNLSATATASSRACIGYLEHPFKNKPFETEKELLSLLANTGGLV
jgi:hypothetical protein